MHETAMKMNAITTLQEDILRANMELLDETGRNIAHDLGYLASCDHDGFEIALCKNPNPKIGLELHLREPRLLEYLGLASYIISEAGEEQRVLLTEKGQQLYNTLNEEGFYHNKEE